MPPELLLAIIPAFVRQDDESDDDDIQGPPTLAYIHDHLAAVLPNQEDGDTLAALRHIIFPKDCNASIELLKITVFLLSNKLFTDRDSHLVCDELLKWFQMGDNYLFLKALLSHQMPTIEAFAEGILASALNSEDRRMTKICLDSGMDPNIIIDDRLTEERKLCSALQFATATGNIELVKQFLEVNSDVNNPGSLERTSHNGQQTPLGIAARIGKMEIAQALISRGALIRKRDALKCSSLCGYRRI